MKPIQVAKGAAWTVAGLLAIMCSAIAVDSHSEKLGLPPGRRPVTVEAHNGLYNVKARRAPVADVLRALGDKAGVAFKIDERLQDRITIDLKGVDFETALAQIAPSRAVTYQKVGDELKAATAYVTSQEERSPVARKAAPALDKDLVLGAGVLRNSDRPTRELYHFAANSILLANAAIDVDAAKAGAKLPVPAAWAASPDTRNYIVKFDHPIGATDEAALRAAGAEICHYVPVGALSVRVALG